MASISAKYCLLGAASATLWASLAPCEAGSSWTEWRGIRAVDFLVMGPLPHLPPYEVGPWLDAVYVGFHACRSGIREPLRAGKGTLPRKRYLIDSPNVWMPLEVFSGKKIFFRTLKNRGNNQDSNIPKWK